MSRRPRSTRLKMLALSSALLIMAMGCSAVKPQTSGGGGSAGGQVVSGTPIGDFDPNATFTWGYTVGPSSMDPHRGSSGFDQNWLFPAYDRLVYMAPDGKPQPMLATEWALAPDKTSLDMKLRAGVVFHDGTPFDAQAVKINLDRARTDPKSTLKNLLSSVAGVDVTGPLSIKINLSGPAAALIPTLGDRAGMIISPAALSNPDLDRIPVGAGPYKVTEYRQGDRVVYEKFDKYYDPKVQRTAKIVFRIMADDETRLNAIRAKEVNIGIVRESQIPAALKQGLNILDGPRPSYYSFSVNTHIPPFDKPLVRQALEHAINRDEIGNGILRGYCEPQIQPWPKTSWAYDKKLGNGLGKGQYGEYNPELAKQLLQQAGLPNGFTFEAIVSNITGYVTIAEALQAQFAKVGVTMNVRQVEASQGNTTFYVQKSVPAYVYSFEPTGDESGPLTTRLIGKALGNTGQNTSPKLEELYAQQASVLTPEERAPIFRDIMAELIKVDMHEMTICMRRRQEVFVPGLQGLNIYPSGARDYRGVAVPKQ